MDGFHRSNPQVTPMPTAAAAPVASAEDEAIKKNTDCVYFLASPLTCKKGNECEYRHSDSARLNPRDCWYWLNGNCLNPKCAFRHPPLDALLGPEVPNHAEAFMPPAHAMAAAAQMPYVSNKHGVPCIFFQQGICMKGDRCSFFHTQTSLANKAPQKQGSLPSATEAAPKKTFGVLEKCTQLKNNPQINALKSGGIQPAAKPVLKEGLPQQAKNHFLADKNTTPSSVNDDERSKYKPTSAPPNGNPVSRTSQMQPGFDDHDDNMHNKDEEISREASPGFDVLVDDELRDSDYYPVEDQYGGAGDHERSEYDVNPSAYYSMRGIDQDVYREAHNDYDKLYGWEKRGASSETKSGRSYPDRRQYGNNTNSLDHVGESDLRHRLSKPRKVNGLRSVISKEHTHHERRAEGKGNYRGSWRERNNLSSSHESSSIGSRLRGRISVPVRSSSPLDVTEIPPEVERGRDRDRLSHGRLQERMRGRLQDDPGFVVGRHSRGPLLRRDVFGEDGANFAAPKSLSELKGMKSGVERNGELSHLGKRKLHQNLDDLQPSGGGDLSFEGPKPLEEILKRKRRASDNNSEDHNNHQKEKTTSTIEPSSFQKEDIQPPPLSSSINHSGELENNKSVDDDLEGEDGMIADEEGAEYEDDVAEDYDGDQQDVEEDYYEQVDGDEEDVNLNDPGENVDPEDEEYLYDDDDADDFAKKMAVVFS